MLVTNALGVAAVGGLWYGARVAVRAGRQTTYTPVAEDWIWYVVLPLVGYLDLGVAAWLVSRGATSGPFLVAGGALLLLFIGIHNAWDTVTYVVTSDARHASGK